MSVLMLAKVKSAMTPRSLHKHVKAEEDVVPPVKIGMVVDMADHQLIGGIFPVGGDKQELPYGRPEFLHFNDEDVLLALDQQIRPVLCPKFPQRMPAYAGYAECCNAGKSDLNEDMAAAKILSIQQRGHEPETAVVLEERKNAKPDQRRRTSDEDVLSFSPSMSSDESPGPQTVKAAYYGIFDGHAGSGAAIMSSNRLHEHLKSRLSEVIETVQNLSARECSQLRHSRGSRAINDDRGNRFNHINSDSLIVGALEQCFAEMDNQIAEEKSFVRVPGGCAVITALFCFNKIFVANAGDCRAILVTGSRVQALSHDMSPIRERKRLQYLAFLNEDALNNSFSRLEYSRFLTRKDLGRKVLYRDYFMDGWAAKTVKEADLKPSLISTRAKKTRLLNTIGVSRGFGDHHLMTYDDKVAIKPFMTPAPEVTVFDISELSELGDQEVLVMASDGLWDVLSNEDVAQIVRSSLSQSDPADLSRYTTAAQELAAAARGEATDACKWRLTWNKDNDLEHIKESPTASSTTSYGTQASMDDITVFVIPLKYASNLPKDDDDDDDDELLVI